MFKSHSSIQPQDRTCRLCTQEVSDAIHLYSEDSVERGVANRMANVLELPFDQEDGLSSYVCQLCNARFNHLVRALAVNRLHAKKSYEKLAENAGLLPCGEGKLLILPIILTVFTVMFAQRMLNTSWQAHSAAA